MRQNAIKKSKAMRLKSKNYKTISQKVQECKTNNLPLYAMSC